MSMKAIGIAQHGGVDALKLQSIPRPVPTADEVLIKHHAFSINPVDVGIRQGNFPIPPLDFRVLGSDASGVVEAVGANVSHLKIGDEVFYMNHPFTSDGCYSEYSTVLADWVGIKPSSVDHVTAASMPLVTMTAWQAFERKLHLKIPTNDEEAHFYASKVVFIAAGAGGVGSIAVQLAKRVWKFGTVIATASRPESASWCREQGADHIFDSSKNWKIQLAESGITGVDFFFLGGAIDDHVETVVSMANPHAEIVSIYLRDQVSIPLQLLIPKFIGISFTGLVLEGNHARLSQFATLVDQGIITPWITKSYDKATVDTIAEGHNALATGKTIGKISYAANF